MQGQALALLSRTSWPGGGVTPGECEFTPVFQHLLVGGSPVQFTGIPQALSVHPQLPCADEHTHTYRKTLWLTLL